MPRPSTRTLEALPAPRRLEKLSRSLALLDAMMEPEWDLRFHSFDRLSTSDGGGSLATMRDGEGNFYYARVLDDGSAVLRGFDHESVMSPFRRKDVRPWPGLFDGMPRSLLPIKNGADIAPEEVTFVLWHGPKGAWQIGPVRFPEGNDRDGSARLLSFLDEDPRTYVAYAKQRWGRDVPIDAVRAVYAHAPIDATLVRRIHPDADFEIVLATAREIGFDVRGPMKGKNAKPSAVPKVPETPAAPASKKKINMGHTSFTVEARGDTIKMIIGDGVVAESTVEDRKFYERLFEDVKARIRGAKGGGRA